VLEFRAPAVDSSFDDVTWFFRVVVDMAASILRRQPAAGHFCSFIQRGHGFLDHDPPQITRVFPIETRTEPAGIRRDIQFEGDWRT